MGRRKGTAAQQQAADTKLPPQPPIDPERLAQLARQQRVTMCEKDIQEALRPIFAKYGCRFVVVQEYIDGMPQPARIAVMAVQDAPPMSNGNGG